MLAGRPEFLGKARHHRNTHAKRFRALLKRLQSGDTGRLAAAVDAWVSDCLAAHPDAQRLIISDEDLSSGYGPGACHEKFPVKPTRTQYAADPVPRPAPIVSLLDDHVREAWTPGRVKVLIVLRNQVDWLASLYSQLSNRIVDASQRDFEFQVERIVAAGDPYLDWSAWVADLRQALGDDNVCVLLMEEIRSAGFWSRLAGFTGLDDVPVEALASGDLAGLNVRATGDGWGIRRLTYRAVLARLRGLRGRGRTFRLTGPLRDRIRDHVAPCNARLAGQLGRDLGSFGY